MKAYFVKLKLFGPYDRTDNISAKAENMNELMTNVLPKKIYRLNGWGQEVKFDLAEALNCIKRLSIEEIDFDANGEE